jgi:CheY-like chemotaxis protein
MVVLYIDDDQEDCEIMEEAVSKVDASVTFVPFMDCRDALSYLNEMPILPDFVFLDINMPVMNGKECLATIKSIERLKDVPVIMCSTTPLTSEMKTYFQSGIYDFIVKPNSFEKLCLAVDSIFHSQNNTHSGLRP